MADCLGSDEANARVRDGARLVQELAAGARSAHRSACRRRRSLKGWRQRGRPRHTGRVIKLPRVECPSCGRPIAAGLVAGRLSKGRLWRHDAPDTRRDVNGHLLSCPGSLEIVELPTLGVQLTFGVDSAGTSPAEAMALF